MKGNSQLVKSLEYEWQRGIKNANELLTFSTQFITVDRAINSALSSTQLNDLLPKIAILSDLIYDLEILRYSSTSLSNSLNARFIKVILIFLPFKPWFIEQCSKNTVLHFDHPYNYAAEGFWCFYESYQKVSDYESIWASLGSAISTEEDNSQKNENQDDLLEKKVLILTKASEAFERIRNLKYGEEMYCLANNLRNFTQAQNLEGLLNIPIDNSLYTNLQAKDSQTDLLRPQTWKAIGNLLKTLEELRIVNQSKSRAARSFAFNRAIGKVNEVTVFLDELPTEVSRLEKPILKDIATRWRDILNNEASAIGQIEIDKPIANPYTIGDPVLGDRFIGREDILHQLEELWFINTSPQSVILYGHRRMGKTSILRNATTKVNDKVYVAYINLLSIGNAPNGITDILILICDAIEEVTKIPKPNDQKLLQFPENTFRRYLEKIAKTFKSKRLIIALDEFEKIEELIDAGKLSKDFLGFLRGMVQMSSKLAFAFAGLHTLQEMNADYFQPFYASFIPISVAFLNRDATHQVLANPDPEFLLEYEPTALDHIYDLTNGQPYLTQLIGFQLVRLFNDYVFEQGKPRDRTFTIDDVRTICSGENFFTTGINYFNGVWQQASEGAAHQQDILKALAPHPQGLTESELISQSNLPSATLQAALKTLKDHDVIRSQKTDEIVNYAIAVELFRTWVVKYKLSDT
jgi:hypothetical protein